MKITKISVFNIPLPYVDGFYAWGAGNRIETAFSSVVVIDTDAGLTGAGEFCPCGENYMNAHSQGVEAAARLLAPVLLGEDPRHVARIERLMDNTIGGHGYAKAPFDAACWDILGKSLDCPVFMLMGGKLTDGAPLYRVAPQRSPEETHDELERHRANGYRQFQIKVGADWARDIETIKAIAPLMAKGEKALADANQGWRADDALRVARATRDLDYILEQPCKSYEECQRVRRRTDLPMKLDECVTDMRVATRIVEDNGADIVCLKISNLGGLSKARRVRDYLVENRISVVSEDTWGGEITTAAVNHFAASTPPEFLTNTTDLCNYVTTSTGMQKPTVKDGRMYVSDAPGLGTDPNFQFLGTPIAVYGE